MRAALPLVRSGAVDIVVIDSVAALVPRAELEGEMGDTHVGLHARLMSQALRKLTGSVSKSHTMLIFLNQIRLKIGVMFGNPETTTGGNALTVFNAELRAPIWRDLGGVVFVDAGNVFRRVSDLDLGALRASAGFGVRYKSPVGPVRVDFGFRLNSRRGVPTDDEPSYIIHFSIGQAF